MIKIFIGLGIIGAGFFAFGYPQLASVTWVFANTGLAEINYRDGNKSQALLFFVYLWLAVIGAVKWSSILNF